MIETFVVAICTLGQNPNLEKSLAELVAIKSESNFTIEILLVINNSQHDCNFDPQVLVVFEPTRGYASVRNAAIANRKKNANLIFIDDDEIPSFTWFENLVAKHMKYPQDVIFGPVYPEKFEGFESYRGQFRQEFERLSDEAVVNQCATANMLIPASLIDSGLVYFDTFFNHSGGEDTDLCFRLRTLGVKIRYAKNAALAEVESVDRISPEYLWLRKCKEVVTYSLVVRRNSGPRQRIWRFLTLGIRVFTFGVGALFSAKAQRTTWMYLKSLEALLSGRNI